MLILMRRVGEMLHIGSEITVTVLSVRGSQVRIGIDAPRNVSVHREEVFNRMENQHAHAAPQSSLRPRRL